MIITTITRYEPTKKNGRKDQESMTKVEREVTPVQTERNVNIFRTPEG